MKRQKLISHISRHGCVLVREGGKHSWWGNPANNRRSSVPRHREIDDHLARKICRDLGMPSPPGNVLILHENDDFGILSPIVNWNTERVKDEASKWPRNHSS